MLWQSLRQHKTFEFKIAQIFYIQIFYWRVFRKIVILFAHSKSIGVSHQLKLHLSDRVLGQNKYTPQQWHFALSTMKLALKNQDITGLSKEK